jgi:ceramide glucosyltransferase
MGFDLAVLVAGALAAASIAYVAIAAVCVRRFAVQARLPSNHAPPATVLKPLFGAEPLLYESLRTFFVQDYPDYQIVFGVTDAGDPARAVAERLIAEFPARDAVVVTDSRVNGRNPKISNLINMMAAVRHDVLAISDSDIAVGPDYLSRVVAPLADPAVGAVTCAYIARAAAPCLAARLASQHINDWFLPSVMVARTLGQANFCMGSTMAVRRDSLAEIGGLAALRNELADDYMLGRRLAERGRRVVLADRLVETVVSETDLRATARHELRWARTIRGVEPAKYAASCIENTVSMCALAALILMAAGAGLAAATVFAAGIAARLALHAYVHAKLAMPDRRLWLVPFRDLMSLCLFAASFLGREVVWRGRTLTTDRSGTLIETGQRAP